MLVATFSNQCVVNFSRFYLLVITHFVSLLLKEALGFSKIEVCTVHCQNTGTKGYLKQYGLFQAELTALLLRVLFLLLKHL